MARLLPLVMMLLLLPLQASGKPDWLLVDNAGNAADTTSFGAVADDFFIAKFETSNAEYAAFLNAVAETDTNGLYNLSMGSDATNGGINRFGVSGSFTYAEKFGFSDKPVNYVSF